MNSVCRRDLAKEQKKNHLLLQWLVPGLDGVQCDNLSAGMALQKISHNLLYEKLPV